MALKTVGDLLNLPEALVNELEVKSKRRAAQTAAEWLGDPYSAYPPRPVYPYYHNTNGSLDVHGIRKFTSHIDEV